MTVKPAWKQGEKQLRRLLLIALILLPVLADGGQDNSDKDTAFKASFIIDLLAKVEWPHIDKTQDTTTAVITVVGETQLAAKLSELAKERTIGGKKTAIQTITVNDDFSGPRILFVATSDLKDLARILKKVGTAPILTVSDLPGHARYGVMINFYKDEGSADIKYEVNKLAAKSAGLKLDPDLLKAARII
jgi:hypothetical protein